ncbi:MAG: hypothetical protein AMXMBFR64_45820 [Myxococcales bacterium]
MEKLITQVGERLDRGDLHALQDLVYEYLGRVLGGVLGPGSGVLTVPSIDILPFFRLGLGEALLLTTVPGGSHGRLPTGRLVRYDPTLPGQDTEVDLSGFVGVPTFIWARAVTGPMDSDTRRAWDIDSQSEEVVSMTTRLRERVEWSAGHTKPVGDGWFQAARVGGWLGSVPVVVWIHAWDRTQDGQSSATQARALMAVAGLPGDHTWLGLGAVVQAALRALGRIHDTAEGVEWYKAPPRGLKQVDAALTRLEASRRLAVESAVLIPSDQFLSGIFGLTFFPGTYPGGQVYIPIREPAGRVLVSVDVSAHVDATAPQEPDDDNTIAVKLLRIDTVSEEIVAASDEVTWLGANDADAPSVKTVVPSGGSYVFAANEGLWLRAIMTNGGNAATLKIKHVTANFGA